MAATRGSYTQRIGAANDSAHKAMAEGVSFMRWVGRAPPALDGFLGGLLLQEATK